MSDRASFPILKNSVILQIMDEVDIPLTEAELIDPGRCKERVREVFARLLLLCWGSTPNELTSIPTRLTNTSTTPFTHPQLYTAALPEIKFFTLLSTLLQICGNPDFGFKDLQNPTSKRFKKQLSALINFLKYKEDMQHLIEQGLEEREELFAAMDEVTLQSQQLDTELQQMTKIHSDKLTEREAAFQECKEMEADIATQNRKQASIRQETYILKKRANELKDQIANLSISLREVQGEERMLQKEVVECPDRIKFELGESRRGLEECLVQIGEVEEDLKVMEKKVQNVIVAEGEVRRVMQVMEEMDGRVQEYEVVREDLEDVQRRLEEGESGLEERRVEMSGMEKKLKIVEQRKAETSKLLHKALHQSEKEVQSAVSQLRIVEKDRSDGFARIEQSQQRVQDLELSMEEERKRVANVVDSRIASFREFEKTFFEQDALDKIICA